MKHQTCYVYFLMLFVSFKTYNTHDINAVAMSLNVCNYTNQINYEDLQRTLIDSNVNYTNITQLNLQGMFRTCSNGRASFSPTIVPQKVHVQRCKTNTCSSCDYLKWADEADSIVSKEWDNFFQYKFRIYILPDISACNFAGLADVAPCTRRFCRTWIHAQFSSDIATYFHELGHNLGLNHASLHDKEYADLSDAMGYCCNLRCFSAPHSHMLSWSFPTLILDASDIITNYVTLKQNEYVMIINNQTDVSTYIQYRYGTNEYDVNNNDISNEVQFFGCVNIYQGTGSSKFSNLVHLLCDVDDTYINESFVVQHMQHNTTYVQVYIHSV